MSGMSASVVSIKAPVLSQSEIENNARLARNSKRYRDRQRLLLIEQDEDNEDPDSSALVPLNSSSSSSLSVFKGISKYIQKGVESIEHKGYYITKYNQFLDIYIDGFNQALNLEDKNRFEFDIEITGKQRQYVMIDTYAKELWSNIEKYMRNEMDMVKEYFKKKGDLINRSNIKFTTNHIDEEILNCSEQYPHRDVSTDNYIFLIVVLSDSVIGTNIYGSLDKFSGLKTKQDVTDFFTVNPVPLRRGQCLILRPSIIHGGPNPGPFKRDLMYLEFTGTTVGDKKFPQTFVNEYELPDYYKDALNDLQKERKWVYPSDKKKNKKKIPLPVSTSGQQLLITNNEVPSNNKIRFNKSLINKST